MEVNNDFRRLMMTQPDAVRQAVLSPLPFRVMKLAFEVNHPLRHGDVAARFALPEYAAKKTLEDLTKAQYLKRSAVGFKEGTKSTLYEYTPAFSLESND
jgi:hypothetical protein